MQNISKKISAALERLNSILPLEHSQQSLPSSFQDLHRAILRSYVDLGRTYTRDEMAQQVDDIDAATEVLKEKDLVVFDANVAVT